MSEPTIVVIAVLIAVLAIPILSVGLRWCIGIWISWLDDRASHPVPSPSVPPWYSGTEQMLQQQEERRQASLGLFGYHAVEAYPPVFSRGPDGRAYWAKGDPYVWIDPFEGASSYG